MLHPTPHGQSPYWKLAIFIILVMLAATFVSNGRTAAPVYASSTGPEPSTVDASALSALGRKIFLDTSLSASGGMSCATCHSPTNAYGPPNGLAVQLGGPNLDRQGARSVPSLRYDLNRTPIWNKEFIGNPAERTLEGEEPPTGGFGWDGRFNALHDQATFPLLAPNEMANASPEEVVTRLKRAPYADDIRKAFGAEIFDEPSRAFTAMLTALERFELDDPTLHPYNSKYDDFLDGKVKLTAQEQRGLDLFNDPKRGNCATCHLDRKGMNGSHPL